jgi:hypothetical protein
MNQHIPLSNIINKLQRKELLLKLEYDYEKETFRQQTEAMGIGRKVKRGMCWYPISAGRSYYNEGGDGIKLARQIYKKYAKEIIR